MIQPFIVTASLLSAFVIVQFAIDTMRSRSVRTLQSQLTAAGLQAARKRITVVLRAGSRKGEVVGALEHLAAHEYPLLQIVLVPRSPRKGKSLDYVTAFRTSHPSLDIRVIRSAGRVTTDTIEKRHARGELIVYMGLQERFGPRFFDLISAEFLDSRVGRVNVPFRRTAGSTIAGLIAQWTQIRSQAFGLLGVGLRPKTLSVSRRTIPAKSIALATVTARSSVSVNMPSERNPLRERLFVTLNILLSIVLAYTAIMLMRTEWIFSVLAIIVIYLLANMLWLLALRPGNLAYRMLLIAALPFALIGDVTSRPRP
jgi:hypothetical protein